MRSCAMRERVSAACSTASAAIDSSFPLLLFAYSTLFCTREKPRSSATISLSRGRGTP